MRYYEDLMPGERRQSGAKSVSRDEITDFARRYDPQYFHTDEEQARRSVFGEVVASGIHTMAMWRQLDHQICGDIAWICGVAWDEVRWPVAVRGGDMLRAEAEMIDKRPSASAPGRGVVRVRYALINQNDEVVFTCLSTNLVERRPAADER